MRNLLETKTVEQDRKRNRLWLRFKFCGSYKSVVRSFRTCLVYQLKVAYQLIRRESNFKLLKLFS